jgi:hypothetical protein
MTLSNGIVLSSAMVVSFPACLPDFNSCSSDRFGTASPSKFVRKIQYVIFLPGLDALELDAESKPPDWKLREIELRIRRSEKDSPDGLRVASHALGGEG